MSRFVQVSPLPAGTTVAQVRDVFQAFSLKEVAVIGTKAYLEFKDASDIDSLDFQFEDSKVPALANADLDLLPEDFVFPASSPSAPEKTEKVGGTGSFILSNDQKPVIIMIKECDEDLVIKTSTEEIRALFGKFKVNRVLKWKRDIYLELVDPNETEVLDQEFPNLKVHQLGHSAQIDIVDENFNLDIVEKEVATHESKLKTKKEQEERQRQEELERKAAKMEEIRRKQEEEQRREQQALADAKKRKEEEELREKEREIQRQKMREIEEKKVQELLNRKSQDTSAGFSVRPEGERGSRIQNNGSGKLFWVLVVVVWGFYIAFA